MSDAKKIKQERLDFVFDIVRKHSVSNYEISQNTGLSEAGLGSLMNGETKNPHLVTVNTIYSYLNNKYGGGEKEKLIQSNILSENFQNKKERPFSDLPLSEQLEILRKENLELKVENEKFRKEFKEENEKLHSELNKISLILEIYFKQTFNSLKISFTKENKEELEEIKNY